MAVERTLSIIKPDAVAKNVIGQIIARFEQAFLRSVVSPHARIAISLEFLPHRKRVGLTFAGSLPGCL